MSEGVGSGQWRELVWFEAERGFVIFRSNRVFFGPTRRGKKSPKITSSIHSTPSLLHCLLITPSLLMIKSGLLLLLLPFFSSTASFTGCGNPDGTAPLPVVLNEDTFLCLLIAPLQNWNNGQSPPPNATYSRYTYQVKVDQKLVALRVIGSYEAAITDFPGQTTTYSLQVSRSSRRGSCRFDAFDTYQQRGL